MSTSRTSIIPVQSLIAIVYLTLATTPICGETLHHWRFEEGQFLDDAVGGATLVGTMANQVSLPTDGPGSDFPPGFAGGIVNDSAVQFLDQSNGLVADNTTEVTGSFTIELFTHIEDLFHPGTNGDAVLAAQVTGNVVGPNQFGWAFRVETENGADRQLALAVSDGVTFDGTVSNISISEQTDYYVAAAFDVENGSVTYYAKDLTNDTPLVKDEISHSFTAVNPDSFFQIGNAPNFDFGHVDGLIDEVRFSSGIVPEEELLINNVPEPSAFAIVLGAIPIGTWVRRRITEGHTR